MPRGKAMLIDVDYQTDSQGSPRVRLLLKAERFFYLYDSYLPYFYLDAPAREQEAVARLHFRAGFGAENYGTVRGSCWQHQQGAEEIRVLKVEPAKRQVAGQEKELLKVYCSHPTHVPLVRQALPDYPAYEYRIPFARRYLMDKGLGPFTQLTYEFENDALLKILKVEDALVSLRTLAFDIETYNPQGAPRPKQDAVIMLSYADELGEQAGLKAQAGSEAKASSETKAGSEAKVITWRDCRQPYAEQVKDEKELFARFSSLLQEKDIELLLGYNSSAFDLPYLRDRANALRLQLPLGRDGSSFRKRQHGFRQTVEITGRIHIDLYPVVRFLGMIGALKVSKFTLENAYLELTGKKTEHKALIKRLDIWQLWDSAEQRPRLCEYSLHDATATLEIGKQIIPIEIEMSRITKYPLFEVCNSSTGQLVESLLMHKSVAAGVIIPNPPKDAEIKERFANPIQGAFVKLPNPGIYENLVVFDFRGLYPSIITSHNIDPYTLNCDCCPPQESHVSPTGARFCKKRQGLIPHVLEELVEQRGELKKKLRQLKPDSEEYIALFARSQSLKILANSYYGYLAYPRSRWYARQCGESVTAWGRHYIQETAKKAEEAGFTVLYADTDSTFLLLNDKTREDAFAFMRSINTSLPGNMELELEAFYPRAVFVSKKTGEERGAKKKYAMLGEDGRIKIRGFELVRRDWSPIARKTQRAVLSTLLKDGSKEKAMEIVRETIERLKSGTVPLEELAIDTAIRKRPDSYAIVSPELSAARKALGAGQKLEPGSVISYVITQKGASISEKAAPLELADSYDANYYVNHQVLPSVMKILKELGCEEDDLRFKGKQSSLGGFF